MLSVGILNTVTVLNFITTYTDEHIRASYLILRTYYSALCIFFSQGDPIFEWMASPSEIALGQHAGLKQLIACFIILEVQKRKFAKIFNILLFNTDIFFLRECYSLGYNYTITRCPS